MEYISNIFVEKKAKPFLRQNEEKLLNKINGMMNSVLCLQEVTKKYTKEIRIAENILKHMESLKKF